MGWCPVTQPGMSERKAVLMDETRGATRGQSHGAGVGALESWCPGVIALEPRPWTPVLGEWWPVEGSHGLYREEREAE
ncbi:hypothetical protein AAFF_G00303950 [Aldrovandia affinis]|uniref:Uncharacterized protein n=1 Tax=Aldrovandia affinis TaxID=143900 RepID=A0AAD7SNX5_9TELE|nr:hypothetical protein AAFF_G00303950 [Aldrovandia affinis]